MSTINGKKLRSQEWWGQPNYESFTRRAWLRSEGFSSDFFQNKPVIGICNSWSELNNCNAHLRTVAEAVKRGVFTAGGFPLEPNSMQSSRISRWYLQEFGSSSISVKDNMFS